MKKILIILLSFLAFAPQSVEAVKDKNVQKKQIEHRCPICRKYIYVQWDENKIYTITCMYCSGKIVVNGSSDPKKATMLPVGWYSK